MIRLQKSDPVFRQMIITLNNSHEAMQDKGFQLQHGILYKQETQLKFQQLLCTWVALGTTYPNGLDKVSL